MLVSSGVWGQFVGRATISGVSIDFYRVPMGEDNSPHLMPPHPKFALGREYSAAAAQLARMRRPPGLDAASDKAHSAPPIGTLKGICLLCDFSDKPAVAPWTQAHFTSMLFSLSTYPTGSMRDYYREDSYQLLDIQGTVATGTTGALTGWYRMPQTHVYYCNNQQGVGAYPQNAQRLTEEAVAAADSVVDFSQYASGGAGSTVDLLYIVHAGTSSQISGLTTDFATHKWQTLFPVSVDGVYCYQYSLCAQDGTIGAFAHESGHVLGAPDLYDYDGGFINKWDNDDRPITEWCLMSLGSWGGPTNDGTNPAHHCGFLKAFFGWLTPTALSTANGGQTIPVQNLETTRGAQTVYQLPITANESFWIENRYPSAPGCTFDKWSAYPAAVARRPGIVIYHVDMRQWRGFAANDAWPSYSNYLIWVEDPGMQPELARPSTHTALPLGEGKAHAAFRSDGVARLSKTNPNTVYKFLYPTTADNQTVTSNLDWIDVLSTPGVSMNIRLQFTPVNITFGTNTVVGTPLANPNRATLDYFKYGVLTPVFIDDASPVLVQADPGSPYVYHASSTGSAGNHRWGADPTQANGITPATPTTINCDFYEQWRRKVTLLSTSATHSVSHTARTLMGQSTLGTGLFGKWFDWCDDGSTLSFSQQTASSPPRLAASPRSWTVTSAASKVIKYDVKKPTITIDQPPAGDVFWGGPTGPNQTISGTASDDVGLAQVYVKLNAKSWRKATGKANWSIGVTLAGGPNTVEAKAVDKAGRTASKTIALYYDAQAPKVSWLSPTGKWAFRNASVSITFRATDDCGLRTVNYRLGKSGPWTNLHTSPPFPRRKTFKVPVTLNPGVNFFQVRVKDRARRLTATTLLVYYDTRAPSISITQPPNKSHGTRKTKRLEGTASDNIGLKRVHVKVGTANYRLAWSGSWRKNITWNHAISLALGRNVIKARATDMSGQQTVTTHILWRDPATSGESVASAGTLTVTGLAAQPTRAGGASCTFVLSRPGAVTAEVLNLAGRPVAVIAADKPCADGVNTLLWDGRGSNGLAVPGGVYVIRLEAASADGARSRALATLSLRR